MSDQTEISTADVAPLDAIVDPSASLNTVNATPTDQTCAACGVVSTFPVPNDHNGDRIVWECPECGARNETDGPHPSERYLPGAPPSAGVVLVTDGDGATADER